MQVRWSYTGLSFRHTEAESPDTEDHEWQGPVDAVEFIMHAANLHLFRTGSDQPLWSSTHSAPHEEPKRVAA